MWRIGVAEARRARFFAAELIVTGDQPTRESQPATTAVSMTTSPGPRIARESSASNVGHGPFSVDIAKRRSLIRSSRGPSHPACPGDAW